MKRKPQTPNQEHDVLSRRSFLVGSVKIAAFALPSMTLLLNSPKAQAGYFHRYDHDDYDYDDDDYDYDYDYDDDDDDDDLVHRPSSE